MTFSLPPGSVRLISALLCGKDKMAAAIQITNRQLKMEFVLKGQPYVSEAEQLLICKLVMGKTDGSL